MPEHSKFRLSDVKAMLDLVLFLVLLIPVLPLVAAAAMVAIP